MSEYATAEGMDVVSIPVSEIWADPNFNCRGIIAPLDVIELSKDIKAHGLQQPIVLMPCEHKEYKWKIVAGHRRHKAFQVNNEETVPAIVKHDTTEADALILNLGENLHRKDLTVLQEAKALERLKLQGFSVYDVVDLIGKSSTWVYTRYALLELPHEIQEAAAAGYIPATQIQHLHKIKDPDKQIEAARMIKVAKMRGDKIPKIHKPKRDMFKKKRRDEVEIVNMVEHVNEHIGMNFGTRCLAWAAGNLSDLELYRDIKDIAEKSDIPYVIPEEHQIQLD